MIISKTPLRISFVGGGTDLVSFFKHEPGAVVNTTIDKYVYIAIHEYFDKNITLKYSKTETVNKIDEIKHPLFREALKITGVTDSVEISSLADVSSKGTGMGSSSSFLVGLLNALYAYKKIRKSPEYIAKEACIIERDILKEEGGYQDQYAGAFGGLNFMQFNPDHSVIVEPIICSREFKQKLNERLMLFFTGITRKSNDIHQEQKKNTEINMPYLRKMKGLALRMKETLEMGDLSSFGKLLHENWLMKKKLADNISNPIIDGYYEKALKAGAAGGKISGAGGGGFLLIYSEPEHHENIRRSLNDIKELKFNFCSEGTRITHNDN